MQPGRERRRSRWRFGEACPFGWKKGFGSNWQVFTVDPVLRLGEYTGLPWVKEGQIREACWMRGRETIDWWWMEGRAHKSTNSIKMSNIPLSVHNVGLPPLVVFSVMVLRQNSRIG